MLILRRFNIILLSGLLKYRKKKKKEKFICSFFILTLCLTAGTIDLLSYIRSMHTAFRDFYRLHPKTREVLG